jgi:hypothetical protein
MRGSAKHILDLVEREDYTEVMNGLLAGGGASVASDDAHHPAGWEDRVEWAVHKFCEGYFHDWFMEDRLSGWWPGASPPRWDLISTCTVDEQQGILLVEAKAHEGECEYEGKELDPWAPVGAKRNHQRISGCLQEATDGLSNACDGLFRLSTQSHYQLANRIAHLWKLADGGLPVVLLYLGFTGDTYFRHDYLVDNDHWQRVMGAYMQGVVPLGFPGRVVQPSGGGSAQMLIRSLDVRAVSRSRRS